MSRRLFLSICLYVLLLLSINSITYSNTYQIINKFNSDNIKDTLVVSRYGQFYVPEKIKWGIDIVKSGDTIMVNYDSTNLPVTYFSYQNAILINADFYVNDINHDSVIDIKFNLCYRVNRDTISKQFIIFGQDQLRRHLNLPVINCSNNSQDTSIICCSLIRNNNIFDKSINMTKQKNTLFTMLDINNVIIPREQPRYRVINKIAITKTASDYIIFPQPASDVVYIDLKKYDEMSNEDIYIKIIDINSALLYNEFISKDKTDQTISINTNMFPPGYYMCVITSLESNISKTFPFIIIH